MSETRTQRPEFSAMPDPGVLAALSGNDAASERALALRTRRAVFNAARDRRADQAQSHRNLSVALLIAVAVVMMLMPAIWSGVEDLNSGAALSDLPVMLAALGMTLAAAIAAVLFLLGDDRRSSQHARHTRR